MTSTGRFIGDGIKVKGRFGDIMVTGCIVSSRIISNELMYSVLLDKPLSLRWRPELVTTVLLSNNDIEVALS
jgi:hypothetical protein